MARTPHTTVHTRTIFPKSWAITMLGLVPRTFFQRDVTRSIYTFSAFSSFPFLFLCFFFKRRHATDSQAPFPSMQILRLSPRVTLLRMIHARTRVAPLLTAPPSLQSSLFSVPPSLAVPDPTIFFFPRVSPSVLVSLFLSLSNIHDPRCGHVDGRERTGASRSLRPVRLHRRRLSRATGSPTGTDFPPLVGAIRTCPSIHACTLACQWAPAGPCLSANPMRPGPSRPAVQVPPISSPLGRGRALLHSRASTISPRRR